MSKDKLVFDRNMSSQTVQSLNAWIEIYDLDITDKDWNILSRIDWSTQWKEEWPGNGALEAVNDWVSAEIVGKDAVAVSVSANSTGSARYAILHLSRIESGSGASVKIIQNP